MLQIDTLRERQRKWDLTQQNIKVHPWSRDMAAEVIQPLDPWSNRHVKIVFALLPHSTTPVGTCLPLVTCITWADQRSPFFACQSKDSVYGRRLGNPRVQLCTYQLPGSMLASQTTDSSPTPPPPPYTHTHKSRGDWEGHPPQTHPQSYLWLTFHKDCLSLGQHITHPEEQSSWNWHGPLANVSWWTIAMCIWKGKYCHSEGSLWLAGMGGGMFCW